MNTPVLYKSRSKNDTSPNIEGPLNAIANSYEGSSGDTRHRMQGNASQGSLVPVNGRKKYLVENQS